MLLKFGHPAFRLHDVAEVWSFLGLHFMMLPSKDIFRAS